ncbi:unnamed protein product [Notodromas monacha]|uniref:Mon2/Sec7/BIG1-like HUS domain-containing protein n=1 Tax=Notodromas monacha TaxID=399045 RepID=A0A7R9BLG6_9CRUS|nr:unnamed protein product [Notodromas monacha]CAG0916826.1 unnamed protein product [Notodromas monacha]
MEPPASSVYIIQGEMTIIMTAMRRTPMWSSQTQQDAAQEGLLNSFYDLGESLVFVENLQELDPNMFLGPFLDVIRSEDTTNEASSSAAVQHIADAVTHARFVGTDPANDEVVLMKILQVLRTLLLADVGCLLTNESVCEIMQSCFRICFETRLSELLRKSAEHTLVDLVQLLFARLPSMSEDNRVGGKALKMKTGSIDTGRRKKRKGFLANEDKTVSKPAGKPDLTLTTPNGGEAVFKSDDVNPTTPTVLNAPNAVQHLSTTPQPVSGDVIRMSESPRVETIAEFPESAALSVLAETPTTESPGSMETFINQQGVKFTSDGETNADETLLVPYGLPSVRELLSFLSALINPVDKTQTDVMIHTGLNMIAVALEIGSESIETFPSLLSIVKNDLSRHIVALLSKDRVSMFAAVIRVFPPFRSTENPFEASVGDVFSQIDGRYVIVRMWRIPGLVTELYLNFDCDVFCTNSFEDLTKMLSKNAFPMSGMYTTHVLSLDALLTVIEAIEHHCQFRVAHPPGSQETSTSKKEDTVETHSFIHSPPVLSKSPPQIYAKRRRMPSVTELPSHEALMAVKHKKKVRVLSAFMVS